MFRFIQMFRFINHQSLFAVTVTVMAIGLSFFPQEKAMAQCNVIYGKQQIVSRQFAYAPVQQVQAYYYPGQQVRYFLGENLQIEALAQKLAPKIAPELAPRLAAELIQQLKANGLVISGGNGKPLEPLPAPADGGGGLSITNHPTISALCMRCHSGDSPKGGVSFENGITDRSFRRLVKMFRSPQDVPSGMKSVIAGMSPAQKGAVTEEFADFVAEEAGDPDAGRPSAVPPPPRPRPEATDEGELR